MAELEALSKLKLAGKLHFWRGTIEIPEIELHAICDEIQAEHDRAISALNKAAGNWAVLEWLDRQAAITNAAWKQLKESWITAHDSLLIENGELREEVDRLQRRNDELRTSYDKLKRERDNLADDLLACNREREQLRKHLGIALDHAHDICSLVDIDGNVLDVGD